MGAGKTTFGKRLADAIAYRFVDLDEEIIANAECTIVDFFQQYGEEAFRRKEREVLQNFLTGNDLVIAIGGGTPCYADNMKLMNANGLTVFLDTPLEILVKRLLAEKQRRPMLKDVEDEKLPGFIREHLASRMACYLKAEIRVVGDKGCDEVCDELF